MRKEKKGKEKWPLFKHSSKVTQKTYRWHLILTKLTEDFLPHTISKKDMQNPQNATELAQSFCQRLKSQDCCVQTNHAAREVLETRWRVDVDVTIRAEMPVPFFFATKQGVIPWMFPLIVVPPNHPLKNRVFHYFHHLFGVPLFLETPNMYLNSHEDWNMFLYNEKISKYLRNSLAGAKMNSLSCFFIFMYIPNGKHVEHGKFPMEMSLLNNL